MKTQHFIAYCFTKKFLIFLFTKTPSNEFYEFFHLELNKLIICAIMKTYISSLLRDEEFLVCRILLFEKFRAIKLRISLWFRGEADLVIVYYNNGGANFCGQLEVNQSCRLLFCFTMGFGVRWTFSSVEFLAPLLMTSPTTARIHSQRNAYRPQTSRTTWGRARAKATLLFNNTGSRKPK